MSIDQSFVRVGQSTTIYAAIGVRQKMVDAKTQDLVRATLWGKAKREARVRAEPHPFTAGIISDLDRYVLDEGSA